VTRERRLLLRSFFKFSPLIALTILLSLLAAGAEVFSIGMLIPFLKNLSAEAGEGFRTGVAWVDRHVLAAGGTKLERMYRIFGLILAATWMRSGFGYLSNLLGVKVRARVTEDLRMRIVDQLQAVALRFYSTTRTGEIINSAKGEMGRMAGLIGVMKTVVERGLLLVAYVAFMAVISWKLTLVVLVLLGVMAGGLTRLIRSVRRQGGRLTRANGRLTSALTEFVGGIRTVVAFNRQEDERQRLHDAVREKAEAVIETTRRNQAVQPLSQAFVSTIMIIVVALAVQFFVFAGTLDMALLLAFLFALFRAMPVIHQLNSQRGNWAKNQAALENIAALLRRDDKPYLEDGPDEAPALREAITFEDVHFAYEPGEPVLEGVSVRIPRGQTTALVGATGAGKSTLADLIPRFYDPTAGRVCYDGVDVRTFTAQSLRARMAVVSQSTYVFNDTVHANIAYGDPDASFEQIVEVADQANALGFIEDMNDGFDTVLGERGVKLSGGQRQRVAIARALLRDPEILILDEATSALDSVTEKQVQDSLARLMRGRTVVAIAHRLSTIEDADQVVVLEEGRIVEQGGYRKLLERRGQLWEYHATQYQMA
jgi:subfamily B ATP-binding cassette protein MsbA